MRRSKGEKKFLEELIEYGKVWRAMKSCVTCILDNTDACTRGAGRAVNDEPCEDFIGAESEDKSDAE